MNKTALITGASRGIGKAIAIAFADAGYDLYVTCRHSKSVLQKLCTGLESSFPVSCTPFTGDMGDFETVKKLFLNITSLDVLINNAGISYVGLLSEMEPADWHRVMNTNLNAAFYTSKLAIPLMLSCKKGRILNISSVWGNVGASMESAYAASKGGLNAFTKSLAKELAPSNIQVNGIACGFIETGMNEHLTPAELKDLLSHIPADRAGLPEEVAHLALQLADAPEYLTGQVISLDGGWI